MDIEDRRLAGTELAERLKGMQLARPLVLGLAPNGVDLGEKVARALDAPSGTLAVRKLYAPNRPEAVVGAIAEGTGTAFDEGLLAELGLYPDDLLDVVRVEREELKREVARHRDVRRLPDLSDRTVILVDEETDSGVAFLAAVASVRGRCARVVVAVPRGSAQALDRLRGAGEAEVIAISEIDAPAADAPALSAIVRIPAGDALLEGDLDVPAAPHGLVLFAHGSGSSRFSPRNRHVARRLNEAGLATLLLDLLTTDEEQVDDRTGELRFDVTFLARRVAAAIDWVRGREEIGALPIGVFGASTGAAAALIAAVLRPERVAAVVSRGGRPDLAGPFLGHVLAPTLLIVGGDDRDVLELNRDAYARLPAEARLQIVPRAGHLFEEPGALEEVALLAADWFNVHLSSPAVLRV